MQCMTRCIAVLIQSVEVYCNIYIPYSTKTGLNTGERVSTYVSQGGLHSPTLFAIFDCFCMLKGTFYPKINPLTDDKILDWSKLKQTADAISKCI